MKGSLLISFDEFIPQFGSSGFNVIVNNEQRYTHYYRSNNLYSTFLQDGDVVTITLLNPDPNVVNLFDITRKDYTTDDEGGDFGIKESTIVSNLVFTGYTFTATTMNNAYNFEYLFDSTTITQFQILTESSESILAENNDYINKQF